MYLDVSTAVNIYLEVSAHFPIFIVNNTRPLLKTNVAENSKMRI